MSDSSGRQNYRYNATANFSSAVFSSSSSSSTSTGGSGSAGGGPPAGTTQRYTATMTSNDRDGTTIRRTSEETGKPTLRDETHYAPPSRVGGTERGELGSPGVVDGGRRIEDVSDDDPAAGRSRRQQEQEQEQEARDREYEERMEDEYAKREGGA